MNRFEVPRHPNGDLIAREGSSPFAQRWALAISMRSHTLPAGVA